MFEAVGMTREGAFQDDVAPSMDSQGGSRMHGRRLVAAHASTLRCGRRASHVARAASADQIAIGLYPPDAEMMLATSLHSVQVSA